jgi:hypothetical protein
MQLGLLDREIEAIAAKELPRKIAADTKAADIAKELKLLSGSQLMAHAQSDERIDPFKRSGSRHGNRSRPPKAEIAKVDRAVDRE